MLTLHSWVLSIDEKYFYILEDMHEFKCLNRNLSILKHNVTNNKYIPLKYLNISGGVSNINLYRLKICLFSPNKYDWNIPQISISNWNPVNYFFAVVQIYRFTFFRDGDQSIDVYFRCIFLSISPILLLSWLYRIFQIHYRYMFFAILLQKMKIVFQKCS